MKVKYLFIMIFILCSGIIVLVSSSYNPKIKSSSCQITGKIQSILETIVPIECPNGKMFDSKSVGYSNLNGDIVLLNEKWINATQFYDNQFAIVTNVDQLNAIINKKGNYILDFYYHGILYLGNNYYLLYEEEKTFMGHYIAGKFIIKEVPYEYVYDFSEGLAAVILNNYIGYINEALEVVVPFEYDRNPLIQHQFYQGKAIAIKNGYYGIINNKNEIIIPFEYDYIQPNNENETYLKFQKNGKWGLMNKQYEIILDPLFLSLGNDGEDRIAMSLNEVDFAFLNLKTNELITEFVFKKAVNHIFTDKYNYFENNYAIVTKDGIHFNLINQAGEEIFSNEYLGIKIINESYVVLKDAENSFTLYNLVNDTHVELTGIDILVYPNFNFLAICSVSYDDGAMVYKLYDLEGNELIEGLKVYDYMTIQKINRKTYLYFNGELNHQLFSSYFDSNMDLVWKP